MFILLPDTIEILIEAMDNARDWIRARGFFGLSGITLWIYLIVKAIIWLIVHARFV
jgi:hypothetical protein